MNNIFIPYKRNIDILRKFFSKPAVVIIALLFSALTVSIESFVVYHLIFTEQSTLKSDFLIFLSAMLVGLLNILPAVAFFQLFFSSRSKRSIISFKAPVTLITLFSVICIIILCVTAAVVPVPLLIPISVLLITCLIAMIAMFRAIKQSTTSIYLKKYGSGFLSVISAVIAALILLLLAVILAYTLGLFENLYFYFTDISLLYFEALTQPNIIVVSAICLIVFLLSICISVLAGKYKRYISEICNTLKVADNNSAPPYSSAAYIKSADASYKNRNAKPYAESYVQKISDSTDYFKLPLNVGVNPYKKEQQSAGQSNTKPDAPQNPYQNFVPQNPFMPNNHPASDAEVQRTTDKRF